MAIKLKAYMCCHRTAFPSLWVLTPDPKWSVLPFCAPSVVVFYVGHHYTKQIWICGSPYQKGGESLP